MIQLPGIHTIYFIGIGGISMSGLAQILHANGYKVRGSDRQANPQTEALITLGIVIDHGQTDDTITSDIDLIVFTAAIHPDNPQYVAAKQLGIPMYSRAKLLGLIIDHYPGSVCIAGTHGKTTTTTMIAHLIMSLGVKPTVSVGAHVAAIGGNFLLGDSPYLVVESCEYNDSFLEFRPHVGVILNLEFDHPDHFRDLAQMTQSFKDFAKQVSGVLIVNREIPNWEALVADTKAQVITFGEQDGDIRFAMKPNGGFNLAKNGDTLPYELPVLGKHNVANATAALAALTALGLDATAAHFNTYVNPQRRLQHKGVTAHGAVVIDDYAHHPTEIMVTLAALREAYPEHTIHCLFQPHTYSRTLGLLDDFATAFGDSDVVYLLDIYGAREIDTGTVHTRDLLTRITNTQTQYFRDFEAAEKFFEKNLSNTDLLITMGATNVNIIGESLV